MLIVGAAGQLGQVAAATFPASWPTVAWTRHDLDLADGTRVMRAISDLRPAAIVNCAAYNEVDEAEEQAVTALEGNAFAVRSLARAAAATGATLVHYSTDFVFDGEANAPYREDDRPNPRSVYAASKLLGEWFAAEAPRHYVLRVESLFGGLTRQKGSLDKIIDTDRGRPAGACVHRSRRVAQLRVGCGRGDGVAAARHRPAAASITASTAGRRRGSTSRAKCGVARARRQPSKPITMKDARLRAPRPRYCALSNDKLRAAGIRHADLAGCASARALAARRSTVDNGLSMAKKALITGVTGQDGSYLAELLLDKGYEVYGVVRRLSAPNVWRIQHLLDRITLLQAICSISSRSSRRSRPPSPTSSTTSAAMSFVPASWDQPMLTGEYNAQGVTRALETIRRVNPKIRFYQASSSEMYGRVREVPQTELTPFYPRSPYGVSKVFGHYITVNYRESYDLFAVSGHPLQPRIAAPRHRVRDAQGHRRRRAHQARDARQLALGNLDACRDWGFAGDYVRAMWLMLQQDAARRLRRRHRRSALGAAARRSRLRARRARLEEARGHRPALPAPRGSRSPDRQPGKSESNAGMGARGRLRAARADDGRRRYRAAQAGQVVVGTCEADQRSTFELESAETENRDPQNVIAASSADFASSAPNLRHALADRERRGQAGRVDAGGLNDRGLTASRSTMKSAKVSSGRAAWRGCRCRPAADRRA